MRTDRITMRIAPATLAVMLAVTACGYRFPGGGRFPAGVTSVFVAIFSNRSAEVGSENIFTNDIIYEITRRNTVTLSTRENAEAVMSGVIASITTAPASRRAETVSVERRVTAVLNIKLTKADGEVIWSRNGISGNQTYFVEIANTATERNKEAAIAILSRRMAETVTNQLSSDF